MKTKKLSNKYKTVVLGEIHPGSIYYNAVTHELCKIVDTIGNDHRALIVADARGKCSTIPRYKLFYSNEEEVADYVELHDILEKFQ